MNSAVMDVLNALAIFEDGQFQQGGDGPVMVLSDKSRDENPPVITSIKATPPHTSSRAQMGNQASPTGVSGQGRPSPVGGNNRNFGQPGQAAVAQPSRGRSCATKRRVDKRKN